MNRNVKRILKDYMNLENDPIDDIKYVHDDQRVCKVDTPGHGYYVLAWNLNKDDVMGLIIGEEDEGIDEVWQKKLGWGHEYCKNPDIPPPWMKC